MFIWLSRREVKPQDLRINLIELTDMGNSSTYMVEEFFFYRRDDYGDKPRRKKLVPLVSE
jgi:hypothetical protein